MIPLANWEYQTRLNVRIDLLPKKNTISVDDTIDNQWIIVSSIVINIIYSIITFLDQPKFKKNCPIGISVLLGYLEQPKSNLNVWIQYLSVFPW